MSDKPALSPDRSCAPQKEDVDIIVDFWNLLSVYDELGGTIREELELLEREVTECLNRTPPDYLVAKRLTVDALDMVAGQLRT